MRIKQTNNNVNNHCMQVNIGDNDGTVEINGVSYSGRNIQVTNGRVIIDGKEQSGAALSQPITINVAGNCGGIECGSGNITIKGSVGGDIRAGSADVCCGDVAGNVLTGSGDVECGDVRGNIQTGSGDVNSEKVGGNVSTMSGDISHS